MDEYTISEREISRIVREVAKNGVLYNVGGEKTDAVEHIVTDDVLYNMQFENAEFVDGEFWSQYSWETTIEVVDSYQGDSWVDEEVLECEISMHWTITETPTMDVWCSID